MKHSSHQPSIISLGEVLWDLFPDGRRFGGASANFACHAALLGGTVSMFSAVGNDERGDEALRIMKRCGVDVSFVQRLDDAQTGTVGVSVDASGKPTFVIHEGAAWDRFVWKEEMEARIQSASMVYFGTLGQREEIAKSTIRHAIRVAKLAGVKIILDVNLRKPFYDSNMIRDSIEMANILKLSDEELDIVANACQINSNQPHIEVLERIREKFDFDLVAMTRGADGALLLTSDTLVDQPGIPTQVIDTVGAGDAFTAGLVVGFSSGDPLKSISERACRVASAACAYAGAVPS